MLAFPVAERESVGWALRIAVVPVVRGVAAFIRRLHRHAAA